MMDADFDRKLAAAMAAGGQPDAGELAAAPHLDGWVVEEIGGGHIRFAGTCTGHPRIRDGWVHTSAVVAVDPDRKWMRTVSRYYRLGRQRRD